jgi:hypothetical protein
MNRAPPSLVSAAQKISLSVGRRKRPDETNRGVNHRKAAMDEETGGAEDEVAVS